MKTKFSSKKALGFTLTEMMVVMATVGLLASIAMPTMAKSRDSARLSTIYENLRRLDQAKDQWAMDNRMPTGAPVTDLAVLGSYLRSGGIQNVMNEIYVPKPVGERPEVTLPAAEGVGQYGPGATILAP